MCVLSEGEVVAKGTLSFVSKARWEKSTSLKEDASNATVSACCCHSQLGLRMSHAILQDGLFEG